MAPEELSLHELVNLIRQEFRLCTEQNSLMQEKWAEVRLSDFNLWVAGVGATAAKRASLDSRLHDLPEELSTLKHLLWSLKNSLGDCRRLHANGPDESREVVDLIIENLAMLATVIRRTGKRSRLRRADLTFDPDRQKELREHFECIVLLRPTKEGLFRSASDQTITEDWMSVVPHYADRRNHLTPLQRRLIDANLRRRHRFLCAQKHSEKLSGPQPSVKPQTSKSRGGTTTTVPVETGESKQSHTPSVKSDTSHVAKKPTLPELSTVASTVEIEPHHEKDMVALPVVARTGITAITTAIQYPTLMKSSDDRRKQRKILKCPCCCQAQPETMAKDINLWKKHLGEDIYPYTCIAEGCPTPDTLYSTRRDVENHMKTDHRPNAWVCPICSDTREIFSGLELLAKHVQIQHADVLPMDEIQNILHWGAIKSYGITCCPLCDSSGPLDAPELIEHVLKCTHDFALRALPWPKHKPQFMNLPGTYNLETPDAETITSWLNDVPEYSTGSIPVPLDLRPCDMATHDPTSEYGGFDYFERNDYFAEASSRPSVATGSQSSLEEAYIQNVELQEILMAQGALLDPEISENDTECLAGTRTHLLGQIMDWARQPQDKCIFWLNGMAGTGKSTISRTLARALNEAGLLGATFFFKRGEGNQGNAMKLFPTLIRQLVTNVPQLLPHVWKSVNENPGIGATSLEVQFDTLLLQPLLHLEGYGGDKVIIIDALDECEHDTDEKEIITLLSRLQIAQSIRLRVFLTSRPELVIRLGFSRVKNHDYRQMVLHEVPNHDTSDDIRLFLEDRFAKIREDRNIPAHWPGDKIIQDLVTLSGPLFITATTVCRYIEDPKRDPSQSLTVILGGLGNPRSRLENTYLSFLTPILEDHSSEASQRSLFLKDFKNIIGAIVVLFVPLSVSSLSSLLRHDISLIRDRLSLFNAVLSVPRDLDLPVRLLHLSFRDFLLAFDSIFSLDESEKNMDITSCCLSIMRSHLKTNICDLEGYGTQVAEIDPESIDVFLSPELQYSCRYWARHLAHCEKSVALGNDIYSFLRRSFVQWVEAMSLLGLVSEVLELIDLTRAYISGEDRELIEFLHDARRFVLENEQILEIAPLQIYCSGLVFAPNHSIIRKVFYSELPGWITALPRTDENWSPALQTLEGHSGSIQSVAFSPDSRILASGSTDTCVRLWDAIGTLQYTLQGHSECVNSVVFSPNNQLLASCSSDGTVRLWDPATGSIQTILEGQSREVTTVAFSPDGRLLASGSADQTVRLWDPVTGKVLQTFEGHSSDVTSVAFSPDGRLLASGSADQTVRLWDPVTGKVLQTFEGHSREVTTVAFSPDDRLLASGSADQRVRLWDPVTGKVLQTFEGHSSEVTSVAFSSDGRILVSCSSDRKVKLWETATGMVLQTFEGHAREVTSVAISPDGRLLASGSADQTVRLWRMATGAFPWNLKGHSRDVSTLTFSANGQLLASCSVDQTVRLWDTATGELHQTFTEDSGLIKSLSFSPDGRHLLTNVGSFDIHFHAYFGRKDPIESSLNDSDISVSDSQWIKIRGKEAMWLPPAYRPTCVATYGNVIALGLASGRVSFISFSS